MSKGSGSGETIMKKFIFFEKNSANYSCFFVTNKLFSTFIRIGECFDWFITNCISMHNKLKEEKKVAVRTVSTVGTLGKNKTCIIYV